MRIGCFERRGTGGIRGPSNSGEDCVRTGPVSRCQVAPRQVRFAILAIEGIEAMLSIGRLAMKQGKHRVGSSNCSVWLWQMPDLEVSRSEDFASRSRSTVSRNRAIPQVLLRILLYLWARYRQQEDSLDGLSNCRKLSKNQNSEEQKLC